jgi:hypothetical protein
MKLTNQDIKNIKYIAEKTLHMAIKADYHNGKFAEFAYDVDVAMRAIIEIIEQPKLEKKD